MSTLSTQIAVSTAAIEGFTTASCDWPKSKSLCRRKTEAEKKKKKRGVFEGRGGNWGKRKKNRALQS